MKGLPSAETAAYSDICEDFEQRIENPQWKGFPQFAVTVELIRASLDRLSKTDLFKGFLN